MSKYRITIDGGTTNTRAVLWNPQQEAVCEQKRPIGVRDTAIDGNNKRLIAAVHDCLINLLKAHHLTSADIDMVLASGMITSNVGLAEIPHITAPCGIEALAASCKEVFLPEIWPQPICFIPGIKNRMDALTMDTIEAMDMMRGEEVECCAIIDRFHTNSPMMIVLPGSHNKFVSVNAAGQITGVISTISGELLSVISSGTILADAVKNCYVSEADYQPELIKKGYDISKQVGLARACFSARILNQFIDTSPSAAANLLLGAVLQEDISAVLNTNVLQISEDMKIIITGKTPFRQALTELFIHERPQYQVQSFVPEKNKPLSGVGANLIAALRTIQHLHDRP